VDDPLQDVGVATTWHRLKKVSGHTCTAVRDAGGCQKRLCTLDDGREVEQDAAHVRTGLQDFGEQRPMSPTYVDNGSL
jgi:hypothetical protein